MRTRCWISGVLFATQASAAGFVITVQVYNAANATNLEIRKALDGAGSILRQAGVEARWIDCVSTLRDRMVLPVCVQRSEPGLFVLSILPEDPRGGGNALGFAVLTGRRNGAAVIYPRVVTMLTVNPQYADCNLMASVIAHELGHLLQRSSQHGEGIMKAQWDSGDFAAMRQNRLKFTHAQSEGLGAGGSIPYPEGATASRASRRKSSEKRPSRIDPAGVPGALEQRRSSGGNRYEGTMFNPVNLLRKRRLWFGSPAPKRQ